MSILAGVDSLTLILIFPRIGQTVKVGIDRAGIEAAAGNRPKLTVIDGATVDKCRAFGAVVDAVAIGIGSPRIGREELVEPLQIRLVANNRSRAFGVVSARIGAAELAALVETIGVSAAAEIKLAVGHVLISIGNERRPVARAGNVSSR